MAGSAASISVVSGEPQSAPINTAFGKPLVAKVIDMNGLPVSGVTVTFLPQGQRATGSFAGGVNTAVTDVNGNATSATFTAGGTDGNYLVAASAGTVGPVNFRLSNSLPGPYTPGSSNSNGMDHSEGTTRDSPGRCKHPRRRSCGTGSDLRHALQLWRRRRR